MNDNQDHTASGSVDPLAKSIVDELRKSDPRWRLGFPPPEEMERFRTEKAERDFQRVKLHAKARDREMANLKEAVKAKMRKEQSL
ncbi:MAG: hypothetical protein ACLQVX_19540 [Limisphaerales bacterium]